jgi:hypothetical protein
MTPAVLTRAALVGVGSHPARRAGNARPGRELWLDEALEALLAGDHTDCLVCGALVDVERDRIECVACGSLLESEKIGVSREQLPLL